MEFDQNLPISSRPDLRKELDHFARNPFDPTSFLELETIINIIQYDDNDEALLEDDGNKVRVVKGPGFFEIFEEDKLIATINDKVYINGEEYDGHRALLKDLTGGKKHISENMSDTMERDSQFSSNSEIGKF